MLTFVSRLEKAWNDTRSAELNGISKVYFKAASGSSQMQAAIHFVLLLRRLKSQNTNQLRMGPVDSFLCARVLRTFNKSFRAQL